MSSGEDEESLSDEGDWEEDDDEFGSSFRRRPRGKRRDKESDIYGVFHTHLANSTSGVTEEEELIRLKTKKTFVSSNDAQNVKKKRKRSGVGGDDSAEAKDRQKAERKDRDFGKFEQFGSGIGSKLLAKFGYKGKGLGRNEDGRVNPVEVTKRAAVTQGLGFGKLYVGGKVDEEEDDEAEESEEDEENAPPPGFAEKQHKESSLVVPPFLPEFRDLMSVVDMADVQKRVIAQTLRSKKERYSELNQRRSQLSSGFLKHEEYKLRLDTFRDILVGCQNLRNSGKLTSENLCKVFHTLQSFYVDLYEEFDLNRLVPTLVYPCLAAELDGWNPVVNSNFGVSKLLIWKSVLSGRTLKRDEYDLFSSLIIETIFTKLSSLLTAATIETDLETVSAVVDLFETLKTVLEIPPDLVFHFSHTVLIPRLCESISRWTYSESFFSLDSLVHPWLPVLEFDLHHGDRDSLDALYSTIVKKLSSEIREHWDGVSVWPLSVLQSWHTVLNTEVLASIAQQAILPVLDYSMGNFEIFPPKQSLDAPRSLFKFSFMLKSSDVIRILLKHFFKKWFVVLEQWLTLSSSVNFEEIIAWYKAWKSEFPSSFLAVPILKEQFLRCLQIIERAHERKPFGALVRFCIHFLDVYEVPQKAVLTKPSHTMEVGTEEIVRMEEVLQNIADQFELIFAPNLKRGLVDGKRVYVFGKVQILLEKNMVKILKDHGTGVPVDLEQLVSLAK
jgi:tuftelin-interacting protein 11